MDKGRLFKIFRCVNCPNVTLSHTPGSGCGTDYRCTATASKLEKGKNRLIAGYVECDSEMPKEIPAWCPLPKARK